ncbi:MAG: DUF642 domain-containing protein [Chthoniobacterales bacterium]
MRTFLLPLIASAAVAFGQAPVVQTQPHDIKSILNGSVTFTVTANGSANLLQNPGIEAGLTGNIATGTTVPNWTASGNASVYTTGGANLAPTEGSKAIVLNDGNRPHNAVISQTITTTSGATYTITFDQGISSFQNTLEQRVQVKAQGAAPTPLASQNFSLFGSGQSGTTSTWTTGRSLQFTADSSSTTISFTDIATGASTDSSDGFLDNFAITQVAGGVNYQWRKNGTAISGATSPSYTISNVLATSVGSYDVIVSATNGSGSTTSSAASLTLLPPISVSATNARYFTDGTRSVYLAGEHIPIDLQTWVGAPRTGTFDFTAFTDAMVYTYHMNYLRLWALHIPFGSHLDGTTGAISPIPFQRPGPGTAADGLPKFDVGLFDQTFFDRVASRVKESGSKGLYVSVMLEAGADNAPYSFYLPANCRNSDLSTLTAAQICTMTNAAWVAYFDAFADKMVDTVNGFDNVIYEIANEPAWASRDWEDHVIARIHAREAGLPKQHPVGKTAFNNTTPSDATANANLEASAAEWIAYVSHPADTNNPTGPYITTMPDAPGASASGGPKVSILSTDHTVGFGLTANAVQEAKSIWLAFAHGHNNDFITPGQNYPTNPQLFDLPSVAQAVGWSKQMAETCDLLHMSPDGSKTSTTHALVNPNTEYLIYQPTNASFTVTLPAQTFNVQWMNPLTGEFSSVTTYAATAGTLANTFSLPTINGTTLTNAVLHLFSSAAPTPTATPTATPTPTPTPTPPPTTTLVQWIP